MGNDQGKRENEEWEQNLLGPLALLATSLAILFFVPIFIQPFPVLITFSWFPVLVTSIILNNLMSLVKFLFILFLNSACQQGWIGNGTSCYKLFTSPKLTWEKAQEECKQIGANLVKIESSLEEKYLLETGHSSVNRYYWIGLSYSANERVWKWADGTILDGYENWFEDNRPNFAYWSPCTVMHIIKRPSYYYAKWYFLSCSARNGYICEKP